MKEKVIKEIVEWIKAIAIAVVIGFIFNIFLTATNVFNISMEDTLKQGDVLLLFKKGSIQRGDIVSLSSNIEIGEYNYNLLNALQKLKTSPHDKMNLIKRVVGLPGDKIEIKEGQVYINDTLLEEPYVKESITNGDILIEKIPEDQYFVMGDNRLNSEDSRSSRVGLIPRKKILGKSILRLWPLNRLRTF